MNHSALRETAIQERLLVLVNPSGGLCRTDRLNHRQRQCAMINHVQTEVGWREASFCIDSVCVSSRVHVDAYEDHPVGSMRDINTV